MSIRESSTSTDLKPIVRSLMLDFWFAYDKLFTDMDNLTENEFHIRQHEMWEFRNKASEHGDIFLISLWGLNEKAEKLYGKNYTQNYIDSL